MAIFIDSGNIADIREAVQLGYVSGVTTNPTIMSRTEGDWRTTIKNICALTKGPVYYQIDVKDPKKFHEAAEAIHKISPRQIVLKVPASTEYFSLVAKVGAHMPCCVTAVYSEAQLIAAHESGAKHVAVYVNRITKYCNDRTGPETVASMREIIDRHRLPIHILAASLKSPEEVVAAYKAGAHDITTTLDVLKSMALNSMSDTALSEFNSRIK